jgi:hypothetical protein
MIEFPTGSVIQDYGSADPASKEIYFRNPFTTLTDGKDARRAQNMSDLNSDNLL